MPKLQLKTIAIIVPSTDKLLAAGVFVDQRFSWGAAAVVFFKSPVGSVVAEVTDKDAATKFKDPLLQSLVQ